MRDSSNKRDTHAAGDEASSGGGFGGWSSRSGRLMSQVSGAERAWQGAVFRQPRPIKSAALTLALVVLVLGFIAATFQPFGSRGDVGVGLVDSGRAGARDGPRLLDDRGRMLFGELIGRESMVRIYEVGGELRYTVRGLDGTVLGEDLTASEVAERFPHLDLHRLFLEPSSGAMMSAEPVSRYRPDE